MGPPFEFVAIATLAIWALWPIPMALLTYKYEILIRRLLAIRHMICYGSPYRSPQQQAAQTSLVSSLPYARTHDGWL
ncbi:hypothetical protein [Methylomonas sp. AM2-LC]|uniref:hypothetical protein n=1 Tax=Methylomonas sp. AM2-LC TaxID=3153301 RepID=UPI003267722B